MKSRPPMRTSTRSPFRRSSTASPAGNAAEANSNQPISASQIPDLQWIMNAPRLKHLAKSGATGCVSEGLIAFRDVSPSTAQGKQFLLEPGADCAELTPRAIESLHRDRYFRHTGGWSKSAQFSELSHNGILMSRDGLCRQGPDDLSMLGASTDHGRGQSSVSGEPKARNCRFSDRFLRHFSFPCLPRRRNLLRSAARLPRW